LRMRFVRLGCWSIGGQGGIVRRRIGAHRSSVCRAEDTKRRAGRVPSTEADFG
jgi:hypothetical protein